MFVFDCLAGAGSVIRCRSVGSVAENGDSGLRKRGYRINWHIRPPYVARARQIPSLRGGLIAKGVLYASLYGI
jgi:hypothetical protein